MKSKDVLSLPLLLALLGLLMAGCAPPRTGKTDPLANLQQADGSVVWQDEYRFTPPSPPWELIDLDEDDYSVAFMKLCGTEVYPCQSTFAYAEEPFGYSREFQERQKEFFQRFLWASRVNFEPARTRPAQVFGQEGLEAVTVGREPVLRHKVQARILFGRRGDRVVAFYYTQWRPEEAEFDPADEQAFERFVDSFSFTRPSFYQRLLAE